MSVDKGGLRYPLGFDYDPQGLLAFKAGVASAMQSVDELRAKAQAGVNMRGLAERTRALATATRESAGAARESAQAMSLQERAADKLDKVQFKLALDEEVRRQAASDGIADVKKKVGALTLEERAQEKLAQVVDKRRLQAEVEAEAARRGIEVGKQKKVALTAEQQAEENLIARIQKRRIAEIETRLAQAQGIDLSNQKVRVLSAEEKANALITQQIEKQQTLRALAARGFNSQGQFVGIEKARAELAKLNEEQERSTRTGNSLLFTFRRLIGVFAAFAALRAGVAGTVAVITNAVTLNAQLEQARLGVAALLTGVGDVRDATGQTVDAATRLVLAQRESNKQIQLLRRDAVETAASFSELADTFQQALGPGLSAGLNPDQVRRFTVQISQAASALGLASNQLGEEIRSLLTGAITARTTRIATALGITNEDIKRAKEAGELASFLNTKFQAFTTAGKEGLNTFNVILNNLKDTFEQILGAAGLDFFESLKGALRDIQKALVVKDKDGIVKPNPEAIKFLKDLLVSVELLAKATTVLAKNLDVILKFFAPLGPLTDLGNGLDKILSKFTGLAAGGPLANQVKGFIISLQIEFQKLAIHATVSLIAITDALDRFLGSGNLPGSAARTAALKDGLDILVRTFNTLDKELKTLNAPVVAKQDAFSLLGPTIVGVRRNTEALAESVKRVGDELADAQIATQLAILRATGQGEEALKRTEIVLRSQEQIRRVTLTQVREEAALQKQIADIQGGRLAMERTFAKQGLGPSVQGDIDALAARLEQSVAARTEALEAQSRNDKAQADSLNARADLIEQFVKDTYSPQAIQAARVKLALQTQEKVALETLTEVQKERKQIEEGLLRLQEQRLQAAQLASNQEAGREAAERVAAEEEANEEARRAFRLRSQEQSDAIRQANEEGARDNAERLRALEEQGEAIRRNFLNAALIEGEAAAAFQRGVAQERVIALDNGLGADNRQRRREAEAAANVVNLRTEIDLLLQRQAVDRESLELQILRTQGAEQAALIAQRNATDGLNANALTQAKQRTRLAENEFRRIRKEAEQPIEFGLQTALDNLDLSSFQITVDFIGSAIQGLSATIASSLIDGFLDPQKDIRDSFAQLFRGLAQQLTQLLIQAALVKAVGGLAGGFSEGGPVLGRASGGKVPNRRFVASPAHYSRGVVGRARGGPPPGVAASDTVPAWLTPGEWVMRKLAVLRYGPRFMNAVNQGAIDPAAAQSLVASTSPAAVAARSGGYASGGPVGVGSTSTVAVVATEEAFETLLRGGKQANLRFMRENQSSIRTALGIK